MSSDGFIQLGFGLATTVLGSIATLIIKEYFERRKYKKPDLVIRTAVDGRWHGKISQFLNEEPIALVAIFEFTTGASGEITGGLDVTTEGYVAHLDLKGRIYPTHLLKINYWNPNKAIVQFGTFVLKLDDDAKSMAGHFTGYGQRNHKIIVGSIALTKV